MKSTTRPSFYATVALFCFVAFALADSAMAADSCPVHDLPPPTGKYRVGTTILPVEQLKATGSSRQVQLWYPALFGLDDKPASYVPDPDLLAALRSEAFLKLPGCVFDSWAAMVLPARLDVPIAQIARVPFVMIAPGAGVSRINYTFYAEQLASDGYIVATMDFAEGGFLIRKGKLLREGPAPKDESDYGKQAADMAAHMSDLLDKFLGERNQFTSLLRNVVAHIDPNRVAAVGHSLGGAAALDVCSTDNRVKGCIDLDGVPESPIVDQGIRTSALMLRSHPEYTDEDLVRLHRDPAQWKSTGDKIMRETAKLLAGSGPDAWIMSIHGTGHMSYSDAPFVMPGTLTQFGGTYLDPHRILSMVTEIVEQYLQHVFAKATFSVANFPEATIQTFRSGDSSAPSGKHPSAR